MDPNNEIILKITRKFENIIDKVLRSEQARIVLDEIKRSKSKEEKIVEYHKPKLLPDEMRTKIETDSINVTKNKLKKASDLDVFLNLI
jgi:hypothetical protein